ncbi:MAG: hypothetical protein JST91_12655 [Actinobacteria bacterium]|nr:hypothetical protein [Actinomycetota bacterium]
MPSPQINLAVNGERVEPTLLDQLIRLEVREGDSEATLAALRFRLVQQPSGAFSPLDDDVFVAGAPLAIDLAAPGGTVGRMFQGYVTHLRPHFESIESNCYLEILGMDAAVLLDAAERTASYPDATDSEAVEEVFGRYNITAVTQATAARHRQDHHMLTQRCSDWSFARKLARRNGYCCYFEYDGVADEVVGHFRPRDLGADPQADLTILRPPESLRWIDLQLVCTGPVRVVGAAIDPIRKRVVRSTGDPELAALGDDRLPESIESAWTEAGSDPVNTLLRDPWPDDAAIEAEGTAATDLARFVIEARGEVNCDLYRGLLRSRRPVLVKGIGKLFAGTYYVRSVRTTVDAGILSQTFIAERNATGLTGQEEFGRTAEEVPPS